MCQAKRSAAAACSRRERGLWGKEGCEPLSAPSPFPMTDSSHPAYPRHSGDPFSLLFNRGAKPHICLPTHAFQLAILCLSFPFLENKLCLTLHTSAGGRLILANLAKPSALLPHSPCWY